MRVPQRIGYWSAGLVLVLAAAMLGVSGHGLPALGLHMLNGQAWLGNTANRSVSLIDGYPGKAGTQVGVPAGMLGRLQVVNAPGGAVVIDSHGHMVKVNNASFSASTPITLFSSGGATTAAAAGRSTLYAIDQQTGQIQQLDPASPQLTQIGPPTQVGSPVTSPVVAPDGSLYFAVPRLGVIGHVARDGYLPIKGAGRPGDRLAVVLAGQVPVAADLSRGTVVRLGASAVSGRPVRLPSGPASQVTGSDTVSGLVAAVRGTTVAAVNVLTGTGSTTGLPAPVAVSAIAMQSRNVVLINKARRDVLVVNTQAHRVLRTLTMPRGQVPDGLTVRDRLVFVNDSQGSSALVISGSGYRAVTKYTGPPPQRQRTRVPTHTAAGTQAAHPRPPGAPQNAVATAGNASAVVGWQPAAANGSGITGYIVSWTGSNGARGQLTTGGTALGVTVRGLSNSGIRYTFSIAAVNALGQGPAAVTAPVTPSSRIPAAPAQVTATAPAANDSVTVRWPAANGGYRIASYTVWEVGSAVPVRQGITQTTVTLGPPDGLTAGTPVQFQVQAVGVAGAAGPKSPPSNAAIPYLPPGAPVIGTPQVAQSGTSATLTVSCPAACQQGRPARTYQVTLNPAPAGAIPPAPAAAGGAPTAVTLTGLTPDTAYTASVTVTTTAGPPGTTPATAGFTTTGPPQVTAVTVSPVNSTSPTLSVTPAVNAGGLPVNCTVTVNGSATADPSCGAVSVNTPTFNTPYTASVSATNADGSASATANGKSGLKILIANATTAFGSCTQYPNSTYCGPNSHAFPSPNWASSGGTFISGGTQVLAGCWTTGGYVHGNVPPYNQTTTYNQWVDIPGQGYMSTLYFPSPASVISGLPQAGSC